MLQQGFDAPVLDRENLTVKYPSVDTLVSELRALGAVNHAQGRRRGLMASSIPSRLRRQAADGAVEITLELVQGHAWKGELPPQGAGKSDATAVSEFPISLANLRRGLRKKQN